MSIQAAIVTIMKNFAPLNNIVQGRIFPHPADENVSYPFVSYQRISANEDHGLGGSHGVIRARFQITAWSDNFDEALKVEQQVRMALVAFSGTVTTPSGYVETIQEIFSWGNQELYDAKARVFYLPLDLEIAYEAPIPNQT
jgi:hypothetical protein